MLRQLLTQKNDIKTKMTELWSVKDKGWSSEQTKEYDELATKAESLNKDIQRRVEFERQFASEKSKDEKSFDKNKRHANIARIIRHELHKRTGQDCFKDDYGRVSEVMQEHNNQIKGSPHIRGGCVPVPDSAFETRASVTSTTADSLIPEDVREGLYTEGLYNQTFVKECGIPIQNNLEGDQKIPKLNVKPSFGWVAEDGAFPEQSMSFSDVVLKPLYAGSMQIVSLGAQIRSKNMSAMRFVMQELLESFRSGLDSSFLTAAGTNNTPKGIRQLISEYNSGSNSLEPDALKTNKKTLIADWDDLLRVEGLIRDTNESRPVKWLISEKTKRRAQRVLKFAVNGSMSLYQNKMLGDTPAFVTNAVPNDLEVAAQAGYDSSIVPTSGSSPTQLMSAVCFQPMAFVVGRWLGGLQLQISTEGKFFEKAQAAVRVIDACNLVARRESSAAELKNIADFTGLS